MNLIQNMCSVSTVSLPHLLRGQWVNNHLYVLCFQTKYRVINKDQWFNVLEFSRLIHPDLSNYEEDGACKCKKFQCLTCREICMNWLKKQIFGRRVNKNFLMPKYHYHGLLQNWYCQYVSRVDSRFAPSQCETSLQSNAVSHWLGANLESALC